MEPHKSATNTSIVFFFFLVHIVVMVGSFHPSDEFFVPLLPAFDQKVSVSIPTYVSLVGSYPFGVMVITGVTYLLPG